jgi:hypothetical protein
LLLFGLKFLCSTFLLQLKLSQTLEHIVHGEVGIVLIDLVLAHLFKVLTHLLNALLNRSLLVLKVNQAHFFPLELFIYFYLFLFPLYGLILDKLLSLLYLVLESMAILDGVVRSLSFKHYPVPSNSFWQVTTVKLLISM